MTNAAMAAWRWGIRKNCNLMMEISPAGNYLLCMEFRAARSTGEKGRAHNGKLPLNTAPPNHTRILTRRRTLET